jgi:hypothetical protein
MRSLIGLVVALAVVGDSGAQSTQTARNQSTAGYIRLDDDATQLREDFNRMRGTVRLLFVVDPSCAACLRGMDDMNRDLLSSTRDPRLQTFVVHVPVIGAESKHVPPAAELLPSENVHHYWNASGRFGRLLSDGIGLKNGKKPVYAWDVWLIYGPDATWSREVIPQPAMLMHQLEELEDTKFPSLDSNVFAEEVRKKLSNIRQPTAVRNAQ